MRERGELTKRGGVGQKARREKRNEAQSMPTAKRAEKRIKTKKQETTTKKERGNRKKKGVGRAKKWQTQRSRTPPETG